VTGDVVEVDVFVAPLEVVDDSFVGQLLLHNEHVLKEINDALFNVEMVELRNHGFLILQIAFVLVNQSIPLVDYIAHVVEDSCVSANV
jgi:hypothetical protein